MLQFQSAYSKLLPSDVKFPKCFINKVKSSYKLDSSSEKKKKKQLQEMSKGVLVSLPTSSQWGPLLCRLKLNKHLIKAWITYSC